MSVVRISKKNYYKGSHKRSQYIEDNINMDIENILILKQANSYYHVNFVRENNMGESGNKVFEVQRDESTFILKVTPYDSIEEKHIEMQLQWVEYLSKHMSGIFKPIRSVHHRLFEVIVIADKQYIMFLQEKAFGALVDINDSSEFNEVLFHNLGVLMGNMHKWTKSYKGNVSDPYFVWDNDTYSWRGNVPIKDDEVRLFDQKYKDEINRLPQSLDNYGIIHYDIHTNNFFVDNGSITLFDFDACQFNWYAADIASTVFFMVQAVCGPLKHLSEKDRTAFAESYLTAYLTGYMKTNTISEYWLHTIDLFMKYQMIDEYRSAQDYLKDELGNQQEWYLNWFKHRIIHNISYVSIDYHKVMNHVRSKV